MHCVGFKTFFLQYFFKHIFRKFVFSFTSKRNSEYKCFSLKGNTQVSFLLSLERSTGEVILYAVSIIHSIFIAVTHFTKSALRKVWLLCGYRFWFIVLFLFLFCFQALIQFFKLNK